MTFEVIADRISIPFKVHTKDAQGIFAGHYADGQIALSVLDGKVQIAARRKDLPQNAQPSVKQVTKPIPVDVLAYLQELIAEAQTLSGEMQS